MSRACIGEIKIMITMNKTSIEKQHKDLGIGGWGLENSYGVRILNRWTLLDDP